MICTSPERGAPHVWQSDLTLDLGAGIDSIEREEQVEVEYDIRLILLPATRMGWVAVRWNA